MFGSPNWLHKEVVMCFVCWTELYNKNVEYRRDATGWKNDVVTCSASETRCIERAGCGVLACLVE